MSPSFQTHGTFKSDRMPPDCLVNCLKIKKSFSRPRPGPWKPSFFIPVPVKFSSFCHPWAQGVITVNCELTCCTHYIIDQVTEFCKIQRCLKMWFFNNSYTIKNNDLFYFSFNYPFFIIWLFWGRYGVLHNSLVSNWTISLLHIYVHMVPWTFNFWRTFALVYCMMGTEGENQT